MTKAYVTALLLLSIVPAAADAREDAGCARLDEAVRGSVHAVATEDVPGTGSRALDPPGGRRAGAVGEVYVPRLICRAAVEAATRAFGRVMSALGMPVAWHVPPHPGDFCWSGDLDRCDPRALPGVPALPPERRAFVLDAWNAVHQAVAMHMPRGTAGGVASFSEASLAGELSFRLRESVHGPLEPPYPRIPVRHTR